MAQSGFTPILIYASSTASAVPLAANLTSSANGAELALNYLDAKLYFKNSAGAVTLLASSSGSLGDVVGPASSTDNALARFDLTTGKLIQNSIGILSDAGALTGLTDLNTTTATVSGQLNLTNASDYNLYASGAGANYMAGALGIGAVPSADRNLFVSKNITGGTTAYGIFSGGQVQSDVTTAAVNFRSVAITAAAAFTLTDFRHFQVAQGTIGATSTITTQTGFYVDTTSTGATNNYAFRGLLAAATGRFNLYMDGTANNYLAGQLLVGTTTASVGYTALSPTQSTNQYQISMGGTNTFAGNPSALFVNTALTGTAATTSATGIFVNTAFAIPASGTITNIFGINANPSFTTTSTVTTYSGVGSGIFFGAAAIGNTLTNAYNFNAQVFTINAATTTAITNAAQFNAANIAGTAGSAITLATAFRGRQAATNTGVTSNYNLYMDGTANNYLAGNLGIGTLTMTPYNIALGKNITGAVFSAGIYATGQIQSDVTTAARYFATSASTAATAFTCANLQYYYASQGTIGAGSAVTSQFGFVAEINLTGATNNYGFYGGVPAATGRFNLYMAGTADNYLAGSLGIGAAPVAGTNVNVSKSLTGATGVTGVWVTAGVQSDATVNAFAFRTNISTAAAAFTLPDLIHYYANQSTIGAGSTVTNQYGFLPASTLTGATNNYGFYGQIASGTGRYNLYMAGTANNYLAGSLGIGVVPAAYQKIGIGGTLPSSVASTRGIDIDATIPSTTTSGAFAFSTFLATQAAAFTLSELTHFRAAQGTIGATSAVTSQTGFYVTNNLTGATNNYGYYGDIAAGTGRWNLFMGGTALNYLGGDLGIGTTSPSANLHIGSGSAKIRIGLDASSAYLDIYRDSPTGASVYNAAQASFGFHIWQTASTERMRLDTSGNLLITSSGGLGYGTGSGGAVTQATSRTTGVTLNKTNGAITLVSAAGSVTYSSFTVTNSTVAATDTIIVNQKSGTDKYIILVTTVAAGSFQITFATTSGVTTEQPVFNFAVMKAVVA